MWDTDKDVVLTGRSCVFNTAISNFNGKCGFNSIVVSSQKDLLDHSFQMTFESGNTCTNCNQKSLIRIHRPKDKDVNPADCVDLHCDGLKRAMIVDNDGGLFGEAGTLIGETEYEWDGVVRAGKGTTIPRTGSAMPESRLQ